MTDLVKYMLRTQRELKEIRDEERQLAEILDNYALRANEAGMTHREITDALGYSSMGSVSRMIDRARRRRLERDRRLEEENNGA